MVRMNPGFCAWCGSDEDVSEYDDTYSVCSLSTCVRELDRMIREEHAAAYEDELADLNDRYWGR